MKSLVCLKQRINNLKTSREDLDKFMSEIDGITPEQSDKIYKEFYKILDKVFDKLGKDLNRVSKIRVTFSILFALFISLIASSLYSSEPAATLEILAGVILWFCVILKMS